MSCGEYCEQHGDFRYWGVTTGKGIDEHVKDAGPCPWCRAERAERELQGHKDMIGAMEESARIRQQQFAGTEALVHEWATKHGELHRELDGAQKVVDAVFEIIDSLDDPYEGDGQSWNPCTQEQCANELNVIRATLVAATKAYLAARSESS